MTADNATSFGFQEVNKGEKQGMVNDVFHSVAQRYDLMNDMMSFGMHRLWKDALILSLNPPKRGPTYYHLDVAGGTGDIAFRLARRSNNHVRSTVLDINASMLDVGRKRARRLALNEIVFQEGDAQALPFDDRQFDAYTIAFGIRNIAEIDQALAEAKRVLRRGGRFLCLEFSQADIPGFKALYDAFSFNIIPALGERVAGDRASYQYLVESIRQFPNPERFENMIKGAGFDQTSYRAFAGGAVCLHSGWVL